MDNKHPVNYVTLCGSVAEEAVFSHEGRFERFWLFPLEIRRLSGAFDRINVILRERQLSELDGSFPMLRVTGEIRSYNNRRGDGAKLVITVLARTLEPCEEPDENSVGLSGTLCKTPQLRTTPLGREICDLMLAVNRRCGRSDYLPCICWGQWAREAAAFDVGTKLSLEGRLQSRRYIKLIDGEPVEKTAFEISVNALHPVDAQIAW